MRTSKEASPSEAISVTHRQLPQLCPIRSRRTGHLRNIHVGCLYPASQNRPGFAFLYIRSSLRLGCISASADRRTCNGSTFASLRHHLPRRRNRKKTK